jgi:hypothetical protein
MAKSSSRAVGEKIKTAVVLTPLAVKRLGAACVAESLTQSELVEWLIHDRLKDYSVQLPPIGQRIEVASRSKRRSPSASVHTEGSANGEACVSAPASPRL